MSGLVRAHFAEAGLLPIRRILDDVLLMLNAMNPISWRLHLKSSSDRVYQILSTDEGRSRFWAESAVETEGHIDFNFPNGLRWRGKILGRRQPDRFVVDYFGSVVTFELVDDGSGGTDLTLTDACTLEGDRVETFAGWVSVLMALKAAVDFDVDLRNHDPKRTWDQSYVNN